MFFKAGLGLLALTLTPVLGREQWLTRDGVPVFLHPRRFGQELPAVLAKLSQACPGQVCGTLAGQAVIPLLAIQPECSQQDMADQIIGEPEFNYKLGMRVLTKSYRCKSVLQPGDTN